MVQWLRLGASTAGGAGSIPGRGPKMLHAAVQPKVTKNKKTNKNLVIIDSTNKVMRGRLIAPMQWHLLGKMFYPTNELTLRKLDSTKKNTRYPITPGDVRLK